MGKVVHIVMWKLKQSAASAGSEGHKAATQAISALKTVPGPETMQLGPPLIDARAKGFNWGLYSVFASREALDKYTVSEAHVKVVTENVKPNIEDVMAYDFELDE
ncbi:hypothetical protein BD324DRAFT_626696 [Kockovaella imperatae]|uniref:Stress-response A/B barrel domain-containing protein n=1 Tax=Kockovaella imperatae TaxID=4999 RepID=A0A1Y1UF21_9TREE|nr:hypothetical protein BD324DRAFT_626696 [Kockovaella imperatae]ORX36660.1 hypothetical protein BD324DRAFT_626696 [Kockovaella imperatae]